MNSSSAADAEHDQQEGKRDYQDILSSLHMLQQIVSTQQQVMQKPTGTSPQQQQTQAIEQQSFGTMPAMGAVFPTELMGQTQQMNPYQMYMQNPYMMAGAGPSFQGNPATSFQGAGPKNELKLFVGGLQFQTSEADLNSYFGQFGPVADSIVMREKMTQRGRGFGFVRIVYSDEMEATRAKERILSQNGNQGHFILEKKVDVKPTEDYIARPAPTPIPAPHSLISKPNPYVIAEAKVKNDSTTELTFKYPKQKVFVGGLDFKLTVEELRQHFSQFGDVVDAVILKDIYTGQSRGFGFVTFKDEDVAQNLVKNIGSTTIYGRKVDIKKSEPKLKDNSFIGSNKNGLPFPPPGAAPGLPAVIPQYGILKEGSRSNSEESRRSRKHEKKGRRQRSHSSSRRRSDSRNRRNYEKKREHKKEGSRHHHRRHDSRERKRKRSHERRH